MSEGTVTASPFGDRLDAAVRARESQLVLGLDPLPSGLWPTSSGWKPSGSAAAEIAGQRYTDHCRQVIGAVASSCVAVKLQLASFERLGAPGRVALSDTAAFARDAGLLVIADAKRGDIDVSAASYAASLLGATETEYGEVLGLGADAVTVNALMGADTIRPFLEVARSVGAGVFALVRTSNPGAADIQDLELASGGTVSDALARLVANEGITSSSGLADLGAVVGATAPGHLARLRDAMPNTPILLPGVGAQGGRIEELLPAWQPGPAGGLVTVSRGIVGAGAASGTEPAEAAAAEAARLRDLAWQLSAAS